MYSVKAVKTWRTHDGGGYTGKLVKDGVVVASFENDGHGGETLFWWSTPAEESALNEFLRGKTYRTLLGGVENIEVDYDDDTFIAKLIDDMLTLKRFRRISKTKTLFRLPSDNPDEWRTVMVPYSELVKAHLVSKYGDSVIIWTESPVLA